MPTRCVIRSCASTLRPRRVVNRTIPDDTPRPRIERRAESRHLEADHHRQAIVDDCQPSTNCPPPDPIKRSRRGGLLVIRFVSNVHLSPSSLSHHTLFYILTTLILLIRCISRNPRSRSSFSRTTDSRFRSHSMRNAWYASRLSLHLQ